MAQYFACDWIISQIKNGNLLETVLDKALELDCDLGIGHIFKTDEGFLRATFYARTHSQETLDKFVEMAGRKIGLIDWHPIAPQAEHLVGFGLWTRANKATLVEASWLYGKINDALRLRLAAE